VTGACESAGEEYRRGSINGITVIDVEDRTNTQGMIGLMSDGFLALLHYDNVKVY
jgi:hypothetical protein